MTKKQAFGHISKEQEAAYTREARLQYDPHLVKQSQQLWGSYTQSQKDKVLEEGNRIYEDYIAAIEANSSPQSSEVQEIVERWHQHLHYFYEPPIEVLRGLALTYNTNPDFRGNFEAMHPDLPQFLEDAILHYVDLLETAELERMLAEDEENERTKRLGL